MVLVHFSFFVFCVVYTLIKKANALHPYHQTILWYAGIAAALPGARIGDISHAIGLVLSAAGYPINTEFGGHGIGSTMHQDPHVANTGRPGRGYKLRPGLMLALEPWVMADTAELITDADGWTLRSATGCRTAHSEHTIAITNDGAEILTLPTQTLS